MRIFANISKNKKAFTLIELLVVISIIALLSSIGAASLNSTRAKARDAKRKADLKSIVLALELYFDDNGAYPPVLPETCAVGAGNPNATDGYDCSAGTDVYKSFDSTWNTFQGYLSQYVTALPKDPKQTNCIPDAANCYSYKYSAVGSASGKGAEYDLTARLENLADKDGCPFAPNRRGWNTDTWCNYPNSAGLYEASPK